MVLSAPTKTGFVIDDALTGQSPITNCVGDGRLGGFELPAALAAATKRGFVIDDAFTGQSPITNCVGVEGFGAFEVPVARFAPTTTGFVIRDATRSATTTKSGPDVGEPGGRIRSVLHFVGAK